MNCYYNWTCLYFFLWPLCCLVLRFMASDYFFGIFKLLLFFRATKLSICIYKGDNSYVMRTFRNMSMYFQNLIRFLLDENFLDSCDWISPSLRLIIIVSVFGIIYKSFGSRYRFFFFSTSIISSYQTLLSVVHPFSLSQDTCQNIYDNKLFY